MYAYTSTRFDHVYSLTFFLLFFAPTSSPHANLRSRKIILSQLLFIVLMLIIIDSILWLIAADFAYCGYFWCHYCVLLCCIFLLFSSLLCTFPLFSVVVFLIVLKKRDYSKKKLNIDVGGNVRNASNTHTHTLTLKSSWDLYKRNVSRENLKIPFFRRLAISLK